jgi:carbon-monoxide dehydrogenase medium subunit
MLSETTYHRPNSLDQACNLLSENPDAILLSGCQSLGLLSKEGIVSLDTIIDLNRISELREISYKNGSLYIGALATHRDIETSQTVQTHLPLLSTAAKQIADVQIRNAGTIGGTCAYADPTADYPPVLMATNATVHSRSTTESFEYSARDSFFVDYYESAIGPEEIITSITIPVSKDAGFGFEKLAYRKNDRAIVNVATILETKKGKCTRSDICVAGVWDTPLIANEAMNSLLGTQLTDDDLSRASEMSQEEILVCDDPLISVEYRSAMVGVLTKKALKTAREDLS